MLYSTRASRYDICGDVKIAATGLVCFGRLATESKVGMVLGHIELKLRSILQNVKTHISTFSEQLLRIPKSIAKSPSAPGHTIRMLFMHIEVLKDFIENEAYCVRGNQYCKEVIAALCILPLF